MVERLVIALLLGTLGVAAWFTLQYWQRQRAGVVAAGLGRPVLLYFRSDSCAPCVAQGHFVQQVQAQFDGQVTVEKIDADVDLEKAARYGVFTLPTTLIADRKGVVRVANYGLTDARKLARQLRSLPELVGDTPSM